MRGVEWLLPGAAARGGLTPCRDITQHSAFTPPAIALQRWAIAGGV